MLEICALTVIATLTFSGACLGAPPAGTLHEFKVRIDTPSTELRDSSGETLRLNSFKGRLVVINLWATWCAPCVKELPSLDQLAALLPKDRFIVAAVSQDKGGAAIAGPFLDKLGMRNLQRLFDPSAKLSRDLGIRGLPTTIVIDQNGLLAAKLEGITDWADSKMVTYLTNLASEN
jgi:thiol-disulfide isomerase/thioredoxin